MKGKKILLGITGGIAAYKIPELVRTFVKEDAKVTAVLTSGGAKFVSRIVLETLSKNNVYMDPYELIENKAPHIYLSEWADCMIIAPASADFIAKAAAGFGDELLLSTMLARKCPVGICPSMNTRMWNHLSTQMNLRKLNEFEYEILEPVEGDLACGEGMGRLSELNSIKEFTYSLLKK